MISLIGKNKVILFLGTFALGVSGCASDLQQLETTSFEEARNLKPSFNISQFKYLPRDIDKIRAEFDHGGPIPKDCDAKRNKSQNTLETRLARASSVSSSSTFEMNGIALSLLTAIKNAEISGQYNQAFDLVNRGIEIAPTSTVRLSGSKSILISKKVGLLAKTGQTELARKYMGTYASSTKARVGRRHWVYGATGQVFFHSGWGAIAFAESKLSIAEYHYREVLKNLEFNRYPQRYIHLHEVKSDLANVLLWQGRLTEAEFVARDAIRNVELPAALKYANWPVPLNGLKKIHEISEYSGINAGPFAMLALIFMEQGRLEDALYLAHIAKNMHEVGCSEPESLGYNQIRSIFIRILAQQEDWVGVLQQIHEIRDSLIDHPELFQRYFGDTLDVAEAEINAGTATLGQSILELRLQILGEQEDQTPVDAYERAVIQGLRALAMSRQGQQLKALSLYSDAFSDLVQIMPIRNDSNLEGRRKRIIYGYKQELHRLYQSGARMVQGLNISDELFKLVNATQTSRVQNALAATRVRTTTVDPGLSAVIRQLQGLEQEAFSITETLARISYSDNFDTSQISPIRFKQRLQAIKLASHALREEIENRFPQYAELTQPHPLSIEEAAAYINSKQALLFYHNEANYGYFWMVLPDNETHFRILDLSKQVIERQVQALRNSVDPQFVEKIGDIPKFDIDVAHLLYKELLEPVEEELNDVEELMVVPGASLGTLPFSLLVTETTELGEDIRLLFDQYRKVSWLARKYSIVQLPTVNSLREISLLSTQKNEKKRKNYAGFADPYFHSDHTQNEGIQLTDVRGANTLLRGLVSKKSRSTSNVSKIDVSILPRLPDTRDEVLSIADALDADPGKDIFVGRRASEANVKNIDLSTYRVISFATHGLIPGDLNGLHEPALAFTNPEISGDSENDGVLTATEILGLKLSADIVVLSACNTAAGDGQGLEAVSGLGRSFFFAGARSVLVSNWPVHSAATTSLMSRLFIAIANNPEISRSQNLRLTQLQMIDKLGYEENGHLVFSYAHPIFWAPFTLVGDGG